MRLRLMLSLIILMSSQNIVSAELQLSLSLEHAIKQAQNNDPWLSENKHKQDSLDSKAISSGTLPDPRVTLGLANIAADNFDFNQENMTQLKAGISQMLPRGNTLELQTQKFQLLSGQNPYLRDDRKEQVSVTVTSLWLNAFEAKESIRLIETDRELFEQLVEISEASYSTAYGSTQQQDVVRAQLELTRLDDRLTKLKQQQEVSQKQLGQWVSGRFVQHYSMLDASTTAFNDIDTSFLPTLELRRRDLLDMDEQTLVEALTKHPSILGVESLIKASNTEIELAKQKYKPQWGVSASYGYRGNDAAGGNRADLFSIGVSFDLPIFTEKRQDKQVQSAVSEAESVKTKKWMLLREMIAEFESAKVQLQRLNQRNELYQQKLLPQIHEQAEAALTAYTNDEGDFSEVVRARIDVLDAELDKLAIDVERQKIISKLNYFLSIPSNSQIEYIEEEG